MTMGVGGDTHHHYNTQNFETPLSKWCGYVVTVVAASTVVAGIVGISLLADQAFTSSIEPPEMICDWWTDRCWIQQCYTLTVCDHFVDYTKCFNERICDILEYV